MSEDVKVELGADRKEMLLAFAKSRYYTDGVRPWLMEIRAQKTTSAMVEDVEREIYRKQGDVKRINLIVDFFDSIIKESAKT